MSKRQLVLIVILLAAFWLRVHRLVELPPGLHYDEAANGTLVSGIAFGDYRPIFITSYTGKEILFFYTAAGIMRLIGESVFALRLTSAFAGTLTIAAVYWLGCEISKLSQTRSQSGRWLGVIAAGLLAVSFPHLIFSRMGFRAIMQPLMQTLTVAAFLKALPRHNSKQLKYNWLVFAGVALGLTAYTYLAARLFPLLLAIMFLPLLRKWWRQIGIVIGVAAVVLAPLGWFWVQNPETFWVRIGQVAGEYTAIDYANSYWRSLQMLVWKGDPYMRFNIPDRPISPPYLALFFIIGLLQLIWQTVRAKSAELRAISLLLLFAPFVMILPTALALDEIVPSNLRAIGLFPFILFPLAFAFLAVIERVPAIRKPTTNWQMGILLTTFCLLFTISFRSYFSNWGTRTDNFYESDSDLVALAEFIDGSDQPIYVSSLHYQHPTLAFTSKRYDEIKWILESDAIVMPPNGGLIAYPHSSPAPSNVRFGQPVAQPIGPDGRPLYSIYALEEIASFSLGIPVLSNFSDVVQLNGYALLDGGTATPTVRLFWRVVGTPPQDYTPFVHILDETGFRWAQAEANAYPSAQWEVGEQIVQDVTLELPAGMPDARFHLEIGLFSGTARLPLVNADGQFAGSVVRIEDVRLGGNAGQIPVQFERVTAGLGFVSAEIPQTPVEAGTRMPLTLNWAADAALPPDLSYRVTLGNQIITPSDQPVNGQFPFRQWDAPRLVVDRVDVVLSADMQTDDYPLELVVYRDNLPIYTRVLGTVRVLATVRQFDQPDFATPSDALFGESIRLAGYTVSADTIRLVWQAVAPPTNDYTVFVHVLNPDGTCCIWQQDRIPRGDYATTRWVAGEYIVDEYAVEGVGLVEIGLYDPTTGVRPLVQTATAPPRDYFYLQSSTPK